MVTKPKWMTLEFWAALVSAAVMVLVTLGMLSQEEAATWKELATGLIAAVLPIVALVLGYSNLRAQLVMAGLTAEDAPAWLTVEFWMTLIATGTMVLVAARIVTQEQADVWQQLLGPLVAAVLAIAAYIRGRVVVATQARVMGLR